MCYCTCGYHNNNIVFQHEEEAPHGVGKESSAEQTEKLSKTALKNKRKREAKQRSKEQEVCVCVAVQL